MTRLIAQMNLRIGKRHLKKQCRHN